MTRNSFHGGCHAGFCCLTVSRLTRLVDGVLRCGVGPFAFGGSFAPAVPLIRVRAIDVPFACGCASRGFEAASIIFAICGSLACSSVFCFFLLAATPACAVACFCASATGSSLTFAYSFRIRAATLAFCARSYGEGSSGATLGWGGLTNADGCAKSAANISRVLFADLRTASAARCEISYGISSAICGATAFSMIFAATEELSSTVSGPSHPRLCSYVLGKRPRKKNELVHEEELHWKLFHLGGRKKDAPSQGTLRPPHRTFTRPRQSLFTINLTITTNLEEHLLLFLTTSRFFGCIDLTSTFSIFSIARSLTLFLRALFKVVSSNPPAR